MLDKHLIVKTYPVANEENIVKWKDYRITVLEDRLFRIEKNDEKKFRDCATQSVWFRNAPKQNFTIEETSKSLKIETSKVTLVLKEDREDCYVIIDGKKLEITNDGNLKGTYRTLDECNGGVLVTREKSTPISLGTGVCSETGVAVYDDAKSLSLAENGEIVAERGLGTDEYVFAFGDDYRSAVKALFKISGNVPMIPRYALGNWWSRYHEYTDKEYLTILTKFEDRNVPLTVATIDMDWHYSIHLDEQKKITELGKNTEYYGGNDGWTGYSWNKELFPDYKDFLNKIKERNLKITLNLHPAQGVRWFEDCYNDMATAMGIDPKTEQHIPFDIANTNYVNNYFSIIHKPYEEDGVQFWWIDWQQGTNSKLEGLDPLWALNHYHYLDNGKNNKVPLILSRYSGVGSHRYPLGFSGDSHTTWETLKFLPYFTLTASNVGYTWWSHDIAGHMAGKMDEELYLRHVQYGVFSPINRLHCCNAETTTKEPWYYGNGAGHVAEEWLRLRHSMIPYLYSSSYRTNKEGLALVEPLYYQWKEKEAYKYKEEYLFGGNLIVAPVTEEAKKDGYARIKAWIPEGKWVDIFTNDVYVSPKGGKKVTMLRDLTSIPVLCKEGSVVPLSADEGNSCDNPTKLKVLAYLGDGSYTLYEDLALKDSDKKAFTTFTSTLTKGQKQSCQKLVIKTEGDQGVIPQNRQLIIEYKELKEAKVTVTVDGNTFVPEDLYAPNVRIKLDYEAGKEYVVEVVYDNKSQIEEVLERAVEILMRSRGGTFLKHDEWRVSISKAKTVEEFITAVKEGKLPTAAKLRLLETLL